MKKEIGVFSIICKKELEYNFDKILSIMEYCPVNEDSVAKVAIIWSSCLDLMLTFDEMNEDIIPGYVNDTSYSTRNLCQHFNSYVNNKPGGYGVLLDFIEDEAFCGWLAQTPLLQRAKNQQTNWRAQSIILSLHEIDLCNLIGVIEEKQEKRQFHLKSYEIDSLISQPQTAHFDFNACQEWSREELKKTQYKISDFTKYIALLIAPITLFLFSLLTGFYFEALSMLSIATIMLLETEYKTSLYNLSPVQKISMQAVEKQLYKNPVVTAKMTQAIMSNWLELTKLNNVEPSAPSLETLALSAAPPESIEQIKYPQPLPTSTPEHLMP